MRKRINKNLICSSSDYERTHRSYLHFLREFHESHKEELAKICAVSSSSSVPLGIEEQLAMGKRPYVRIFGKLQLLSADEVRVIHKDMEIIWR